MATYRYNAIKIGDKTKIEGVINADSEREARESLRQQQLYPTMLKELIAEHKTTDDYLEKQAAQGQVQKLSVWLSETLASIGLRERITFTQNLEVMVRAGIPITEALLNMESYLENPKFRRLVNTIRLDILSGSSFSRALGKQRHIFNDIYISIIEAGEASGELEAVLRRLMVMLESQSKLRKKVISALIYPIMVISIVIIVMLIMFLFVLPTFSEMYDKLGVQLPLISRIMIGISNFLRNYWYLALLMALGFGIGGYKYVKTKSGKRVVDKAALKIPVVAPLVRSVASSHFISTLHISFSAGLPITDCMLMACQTVTHTTMREAFDEVNYKIQAGNRIASSLAETNILSALLIIMISSGEQAGNLDEMLVHCLAYLEDEVTQRVDVLMSMMEPVLLLVLGAVVGCMALSIYLPLFGMYEHLGH